MTNQRKWLIAGLGNPGVRYRRNRHNAGFLVIDELAARHDIRLTEAKFDVRYGRGSIADNPVILAEPTAYMNRSGPPIRALAGYYRISSEALIVVHDDIDLAFGRLKIKEKGGHGGHNGVRSLIEVFGGGDFKRLRIGAGRPVTGRDAAEHVLQDFSTDEFERLPAILDKACEALETILCRNIHEAMNRFNERSTNAG